MASENRAGPDPSSKVCWLRGDLIKTAAGPEAPAGQKFDMACLFRLFRLWPYWGIFGLAAALFVFGLYHGRPPAEALAAPRILAKKTELLSGLRINLLKSVEAEKRAVMAETDEISAEFAAESRRASEAVEKIRREFAGLVGLHPAGDEPRWLQEFDACWDQLRKVDRVILGLAVQNTNLKSARISFGRARQEVERFERALGTVFQNLEDAPSLRLAAEALAAELNILALHAPHIASPDEGEMGRIEQTIHQKDQIVRRSLEHLTASAPAGSPREALIEAWNAHDGFMDATKTVIALSRENTNVASLGFSLDRKLKITSQCGAVLARLDENLKNQGFKATR
jgi:hypothetical protein